MRKKYFVIAGNHHQYLEFAKEKVTKGWPGDTSMYLSDFVYVDHPQTLRGYINPRGFFIGSWRDRKDIRDILITLSVAYHDQIMHKNLIDICNEIL